MQWLLHLTFHEKRIKDVTVRSVLSSNVYKMIGFRMSSSHKINVKPNHDGNTLTINYDGSVGETFYQPEDFWASDSVNILYPKFELNSRQ